MSVLQPVMVLAGYRPAAYRGPDRRGIVSQLADPAALRLTVWALAAVIALPLAGDAVVRLVPGLPVDAATVGAADAAVVAFLGAGIMLLHRWRLVGEASSAFLGAGALACGFLVVPAIYADNPVPAYVGALQITALLVVLGLFLGATDLPQICAGLRPALITVWALGSVVVLAAPLTPLILGVQRSSVDVGLVRGIEAVACALAAAALLARGLRARHRLLTSSGAMLLSIAAGLAAASVGRLAATRDPAAPPSFFLLAGAVQLVLVAGADLHAVIRTLVRNDVRGRRRWIAAEDELARARRAYRGTSHDVTSMLSAVDGTLLVLSRQPNQLSAEERDRLIAGVRGQLQQLRTALATDAGDARWYDLSELLRGLAVVHASDIHSLRSDIELGLDVHGRADRVGRIIGNLLTNAERHAPGARVTLCARRIPGYADDSVEITVSDDGPGLSDDELEAAFEPGWRGARAHAVAGSGLGLSQCREMAEAEGGSVVLRPTTPQATLGRQGLTARVVLPAGAAVLPASPILQMQR
ncbi:MAG TPA: sensor histidine kinase [Candidatus Binatia bacterium]|nr:sensor histidine kinase [Candidatus Binatia bacterium]